MHDLWNLCIGIGFPGMDPEVIKFIKATWVVVLKAFMKGKIDFACKLLSGMTSKVYFHLNSF